MRAPNPLTGAYLDWPIMPVRHADLIRVEGSTWRSECPRCGQGMLLVHRRLSDLRFDALDHCMTCGQRVEYLDIEAMRAEDEGRPLQP